MAVDDTPLPVDGAMGANIPNVLANDTLNGVANPKIGTEVNINGDGRAHDGTILGLDVTPTAGRIILDTSTGVVAVAAGTTAGTYLLNYEICEVLNATNCDTAIVTIVVEPLNFNRRIENDLETILEEELVNTLAMQSNQISGYSAEALDVFAVEATIAVSRTRTHVWLSRASCSTQTMPSSNPKAIGLSIILRQS